jgi:gp178
MNIQELIKKYEETIYAIIATDEVLKDLKQLDESQKIKVPQLVADYIKYTKEAEWDLQEAMDDVAYEDNKDLRKWFNDNIETFALAWINGYHIEEKKRYIVKMTATKQPLFYNNMYEKTFFSLGDLATRFTCEELEKLGLDWVFDCPGIEIEEASDE